VSASNLPWIHFSLHPSAFGVPEVAREPRQDAQSPSPGDHSGARLFNSATLRFAYVIRDFGSVD
jgi:hypothetical protein